jgi:hypothetical protein
MAAAAAAAAAATGGDGSSGLLPPAFALAALLQQQQQQQQRQQQQQQLEQPVLSGGGSRVDAYPQWPSAMAAGLPGGGSRGNSTFGQTPSTLGAMFGLPMVGTAKQLVSSSSAQEASLPPLHPGTLTATPLQQQQQQQHKPPQNGAPVTSEEQQLLHDVRHLASCVQPEVRAELQQQLHKLANEAVTVSKPRGHAPPLRDVTRTAVDAVRRCVHLALQRGQPALLLQQGMVASPRLGSFLPGPGLLGAGAGAFLTTPLQQQGDGLGVQQLVGQPLGLQEAGLPAFLGMGLQ